MISNKTFLITPFLIILFLFRQYFFSGISQRDCASYYDYLGRDKADLEDKIVDFWEEKIRGKFNLNKCKLIRNTEDTIT